MGLLSNCEHVVAENMGSTVGNTVLYSFIIQQVPFVQSERGMLVVLMEIK